MTILDLGRMAYQPSTELQMKILEEVADGAREDTLVLVEHDPVLTLGVNFHPSNLLLPVEEYERRGIEVTRTSRGGDVTYHGPGQLVAYPIFSLSQRDRDLHRWLRDLEEAAIRTIEWFGLVGYRFPPNTGVWVDAKKICAIGVKVRRWVSMHGIALNCDLDLEPFSWIVPCGIRSHGVTSLSRELGRTVTVEEAKPRLVSAFRDVFEPR